MHSVRNMLAFLIGFLVIFLMGVLTSRAAQIQVEAGFQWTPNTDNTSFYKLMRDDDQVVEGWDHIPVDQGDMGGEKILVPMDGLSHNYYLRAFNDTGAFSDPSAVVQIDPVYEMVPPEPAVTPPQPSKPEEIIGTITYNGQPTGLEIVGVPSD